MKKYEIEQLTEMAYDWRNSCTRTIEDAGIELNNFLLEIKPDEDEWLDMDSAPNDATYVLCFANRGSVCGVRVAYYLHEWGWLTVPGKFQMHPSFWRPLPPAPETSKES